MMCVVCGIEDANSSPFCRGCKSSLYSLGDATKLGIPRKRRRVLDYALSFIGGIIAASIPFASIMIWLSGVHLANVGWLFSASLLLLLASYILPLLVMPQIAGPWYKPVVDAPVGLAVVVNRVNLLLLKFRVRHKDLAIGFGSGFFAATSLLTIAAVHHVIDLIAFNRVQ